MNTAECRQREILEALQEWLQWGRRVNTAECRKPARVYAPGEFASMGPPREHGGMQMLSLDVQQRKLLQWGRRVNTAECLQLRV